MKKNVIEAAQKEGGEKTGYALEDREGKKMNVGEEMLTKNRVSMQRAKKMQRKKERQGTQRGTRAKRNEIEWEMAKMWRNNRSW